MNILKPQLLYWLILDPPIASNVIAELPEEKRTVVLHRFATLERVSPNVIRELDQALQGELTINKVPCLETGSAE